MTFVPIEKVGAYGVLRTEDTPSHRAPPEAWTDASNVRIAANVCSRFSGHTSVMGTPGVAPGHIFNVDNDGDSFWLYAQAAGANSKVYVFNSGTHTDISQGTGYTVTDYRLWNSCVFQGIPILNYGGGTPQYWANYSPATDLADLTAWPAATTCKILRAFGNFLIALNVTESGTAYPHRVKWSDGAAPGTLPITWDETDPVYEAGELDATDVEAGAIQDGLMLQDTFVVYKAGSTWLLRYIGGQQIMSLKPVHQASGILAPRCVCSVQPRRDRPELHFLKTDSDLGVFDTKSFVSVVEERDRKWIEANIDALYYNNSFVFNNVAQSEAYFCFPESGEQNPNIACVWNYVDNTIYFRDWVGVHAAGGVVEAASAETWATIASTWETVAPAKWQEAQRRKVVIADQASTLFQQLDSGLDFNGTAFDAFIERRDLAVIGQDREGNPIVDYNARKIFSRIWPKITGAAVNVRIGGAEVAGGTVTWGPDFVFDPSAGKRYIDCGVTDPISGDVVPCNTPFMAIRFSSTASADWQLEGYGIDVEIGSEL